MGFMPGCKKKSCRAGNTCNSCDTKIRRLQNEADDDFGNGEVRGDNRWTPPVHATTESGQDVTVSFGRNGRDGHTGIASGHIDAETYYAKKKGHDHFGPDGESFGDRGAYHD